MTGDATFEARLYRVAMIGLAVFTVVSAGFLTLAMRSLSGARRSPETSG